ncbi:MAG: PilZ domain-containing protein [Nannocystaceae bacterium]|nr:PilZ domain-containing protein [Nannocystaceae bacterium]
MQGTQVDMSVDSPQDRRGRPRVTVAVAFKLFDDRGRMLLNARTLDLSTGGALLHGACKTDIGETVRVEVSRGAARNPLSLEATVVRLQAPAPASPDALPGNHGIGIRFNDLSPIDETVLASLIKSARG